MLLEHSEQQFEGRLHGVSRGLGRLDRVAAVPIPAPQQLVCLRKMFRHWVWELGSNDHQYCQYCQLGSKKHLRMTILSSTSFLYLPRGSLHSSSQIRNDDITELTKWFYSVVTQSPATWKSLDVRWRRISGNLLQKMLERKPARQREECQCWDMRTVCIAGLGRVRDWGWMMPVWVPALRSHTAAGSGGRCGNTCHRFYKAADDEIAW